jgi:hypothetical protein
MVQNQVALDTEMAFGQPYLITVMNGRYLIRFFFWALILRRGFNGALAS